MPVRMSVRRALRLERLVPAMTERIELDIEELGAYEVYDAHRMQMTTDGWAVLSATSRTSYCTAMLRGWRTLRWRAGVVNALEGGQPGEPGMTGMTSAQRLSFPLPEAR